MMSESRTRVVSKDVFSCICARLDLFVAAEPIVVFLLGQLELMASEWMRREALGLAVHRQGCGEQLLEKSCL